MASDHEYRKAERRVRDSLGLGQEALSWLLEPDDRNPGARYFALRDLLGRAPDAHDVVDAQAQVMASGPVPAILAAQLPDGSWSGKDWKYTSTLWQVAFLAELAADPRDARVRSACEYVLDHQQAVNGGISFQQSARPSTVVHCGNGIALWALVRLGFADDPRVQAAVEWQAKAITGIDPSLRYYKSAAAGPDFACGVNLGQSCAWGANKALRALLALPSSRRGGMAQAALDRGAAFLLSRDPALADYPYTERVSSTWFRLGFPLSYWSDVLETLEVLVDLGYGSDSRLDGAFAMIVGKAGEDGRWKLENTLNGKSWADIEEKGKPSKWVTLRALRVLEKASRTAEGRPQA